MGTPLSPAIMFENDGGDLIAIKYRKGYKSLRIHGIVEQERERSGSIHLDEELDYWTYRKKIYI